MCKSDSKQPSGKEEKKKKKKYELEKTRKNSPEFTVGWTILRRSWNKSISATVWKEMKFKPQSKT